MEMKEYMTPEMEVIKLKYQTSLLAESMDDGGADETNPDLPERE
jgi:hypothetical protein